MDFHVIASDLDVFEFSPWDEVPYRVAVERNPMRGLSLSGFLSEVGIQVPCFIRYAFSMQDKESAKQFSCITIGLFPSHDKHNSFLYFGCL